MLFEVLGHPLAEAAQYENLWETRQEKVLASLPANISSNPALNRRNVLEKLPTIQTALPTQTRWKNVPGSNSSMPASLSQVAQAISSKNGIVKDVYNGDSAQSPIVLVQDIHLNAEAQLNIAALLQRLVDESAIKAIAVEGAFGAFDFTPFRAIPDAAVRTAIANEFVENDLIGAASYVGVTSKKNPLVLGVDDRASYDANVGAYRASVETQKDWLKKIEKMRAQLNEQKKKQYSVPLRVFDDLLAAHHAGAVSFSAYVAKLGSYDSDIDFSIEQFLQAYELETRLDFNRVNQERRAVIGKLTGLMTESEMSELLNQSLAYQSGNLSFGRYYAGIKDLCERHGISLQATPAFDDYIRYVLLSEGINAERLFTDVKKLESKILSRLIKTDEERAISEKSRALNLTEKLVKFELTPDEWADYKGTLTLALSPRGEGTELAQFEQFYKQADIRSEKIVSNLKNLKSSALIVGGFHTPQIASLLRAQKRPFIVVSPRITKISDESGSAYLSAFAQEKTPLDKLFFREKLFVLPSRVQMGSQAPGADKPGQGFLGFGGALTEARPLPEAMKTQVVKESEDGVQLRVNYPSANEAVLADYEKAGDRNGDSLFVNGMQAVPARVTLMARLKRIVFDRRWMLTLGATTIGWVTSEGRALGAQFNLAEFLDKLPNEIQSYGYVWLIVGGAAAIVVAWILMSVGSKVNAFLRSNYSDVKPVIKPAPVAQPLSPTAAALQQNQNTAPKNTDVFKHMYDSVASPLSEKRIVPSQTVSRSASPGVGVNRIGEVSPELEPRVVMSPLGIKKDEVPAGIVRVVTEEPQVIWGPQFANALAASAPMEYANPPMAPISDTIRSGIGIQSHLEDAFVLPEDFDFDEKVVLQFNPAVDRGDLLSSFVPGPSEGFVSPKGHTVFLQTTFGLPDADNVYLRFVQNDADGNQISGTPWITAHEFISSPLLFVEENADTMSVELVTEELIDGEYVTTPFPLVSQIIRGFIEERPIATPVMPLNSVTLETGAPNTDLISTRFTYDAARYPNADAMLVQFPSYGNLVYRVSFLTQEIVDGKPVVQERGGVDLVPAPTRFGAGYTVPIPQALREQFPQMLVAFQMFVPQENGELVPFYASAEFGLAIPPVVTFISADDAPEGTTNLALDSVQLSVADVNVDGVADPNVLYAVKPVGSSANSAILHVGKLPADHFVQISEKDAAGKILSTRLISTNGILFGNGFAVPAPSDNVSITLLNAQGQSVSFEGGVFNYVKFVNNAANQIALNTVQLNPADVNEDETPEDYVLFAEKPVGVSANSAILHVGNVPANHFVQITVKDAAGKTISTQLIPTNGVNFLNGLAVALPGSDVSVTLLNPQGQVVDFPAGGVRFVEFVNNARNLIPLISSQLNPADINNDDVAENYVLEAVKPTGVTANFVNLHIGNLPANLFIQIAVKDVGGKIIETRLVPTGSIDFLTGVSVLLPGDSVSVTLLDAQGRVVDFPAGGTRFAEFGVSSQNQISLSAVQLNPADVNKDNVPEDYVLAAVKPAGVTANSAILHVGNVPANHFVQIAVKDAAGNTIGTRIIDTNTINFLTGVAVSLPANDVSVTLLDPLGQVVNFPAGGVRFVEFVNNASNQIALNTAQLNPADINKDDIAEKYVLLAVKPAGVSANSAILHPGNLPLNHFLQIAVKDAAGNTIETQLISTNRVIFVNGIAVPMRGDNVTVTLLNERGQVVNYPEGGVRYAEFVNNAANQIPLNSVRMNPADINGDEVAENFVLYAEIPGGVVANSAVLHVGNLPADHLVQISVRGADGKIINTRFISTNEVDFLTGLAVQMNGQSVSITLLNKEGRTVNFPEGVRFVEFGLNAPNQIPLTTVRLDPTLNGASYFTTIEEGAKSLLLTVVRSPAAYVRVVFTVRTPEGNIRIGSGTQLLAGQTSLAFKIPEGKILAVSVVGLADDRVTPVLMKMSSDDSLIVAQFSSDVLPGAISADVQAGISGDEFGTFYYESLIPGTRTLAFYMPDTIATHFQVNFFIDLGDGKGLAMVAVTPHLSDQGVYAVAVPTEFEGQPIVVTSYSLSFFADMPENSQSVSVGTDELIFVESSRDVMSGSVVTTEVVTPQGPNNNPDLGPAANPALTLSDLSLTFESSFGVLISWEEAIARGYVKPAPSRGADVPDPNYIIFMGVVIHKSRVNLDAFLQSTWVRPTKGFTPMESGFGSGQDEGMFQLPNPKIPQHSSPPDSKIGLLPVARGDGHEFTLIRPTKFGTLSDIDYGTTVELEFLSKDGATLGKRTIKDVPSNVEIDKIDDGTTRIVVRLKNKMGKQLSMNSKTRFYPERRAASFKEARTELRSVTVDVVAEKAEPSKQADRADEEVERIAEEPAAVAVVAKSEPSDSKVDVTEQEEQVASSDEEPTQELAAVQSWFANVFKRSVALGASIVLGIYVVRDLWKKTGQKANSGLTVPEPEAASKPKRDFMLNVPAPAVVTPEVAAPAVEPEPVVSQPKKEPRIPENTWTNWLAHTRKGRQYIKANSSFLTSNDGQQFLTSTDGAFWLSSNDGRRWLLTENGLAFLNSELGRKFLATTEGRRFLRSTEGKKWLWSANGATWLESSWGFAWVATADGRRWLTTPQAMFWLDTLVGVRYLSTLAGYAWLKTEAGAAWLSGPTSRRFVFSEKGRAYLRSEQGRNWLDTEAGHHWLTTRNGFIWLSSDEGRLWFESPFATAWRQSEAWVDYLQTAPGLDWLHSEPGLSWIISDEGIEWIKSDAGVSWLKSNTGSIAQSESGVRWLIVKYGQGLSSQFGENWMAASAFRPWLESMQWIDWLAGTVGREWVVSQFGEELLQKEFVEPEAQAGKRYAKVAAAGALTVMSLFAMGAAPLALLIDPLNSISMWTAVSIVFAGAATILFAIYYGNRKHVRAILTLALIAIMAVLIGRGTDLGDRSKGEHKAAIPMKVDQVKKPMRVNVQPDADPNADQPDVEPDLTRFTPKPRTDIPGFDATLPKALATAQAQNRIQELLASLDRIGSYKGMRLSNVGDPKLNFGGNFARGIGPSKIVFPYENSIGIRRMAPDQAQAMAEEFLTLIKESPRNHGGLVAFFNAATGDSPDMTVKLGEMLHMAMTAMDLWSQVSDRKTKTELFRIGKSLTDYAIEHQNKLTGQVRFTPSTRLAVPEFQEDLCRVAGPMYLMLRNVNPKEAEKYKNAFTLSFKWLLENSYDGIGLKAKTATTPKKMERPDDIQGWAVSMFGPEALEEAGIDTLKLMTELTKIPSNILIVEWFANRSNALRWLIAHHRNKGNIVEADRAQAAMEQIVMLLYSLPLQPAAKGGGMAYAYQLKPGAINVFNPDAWVPAEGVTIPWGWTTMAGTSRISAEYLLALADGFDPVAGMGQNNKLIQWEKFEKDIVSSLAAIEGEEPMFKRGGGDSWRVITAKAALKRAEYAAQAIRLILNNQAVAVQSHPETGEIRRVYRNVNARDWPTIVYKVPYEPARNRQMTPTPAEVRRGIQLLDPEGYAWVTATGADARGVHTRVWANGALGDVIRLSPEIRTVGQLSLNQIGFGYALLAAELAGGALHVPRTAQATELGTLIPRPVRIDNLEDRKAIEIAVRHIERLNQPGASTFAKDARAAWLTGQVFGVRHEDYQALREIRQKIESVRNDPQKKAELLAQYNEARKILFWLADTEVDHQAMKRQFLTGMAGGETMAMMFSPFNYVGQAAVTAYQTVRNFGPLQSVKRSIAAIEEARSKYWTNPITGELFYVIGAEAVKKANAAVQDLDNRIKIEKNPVENKRLQQSRAKLQSLLKWADASGYASEKPAISLYETTSLIKKDRLDELWDQGRYEKWRQESDDMAGEDERGWFADWSGVDQARRRHKAFEKGERPSNPGYHSETESVPNLDVIVPISEEGRPEIREEMFGMDRQGRRITDSSKLVWVRVSVGEAPSGIILRDFGGKTKAIITGHNLTVDGESLEERYINLDPLDPTKSIIEGDMTLTVFEHGYKGDVISSHSHPLGYQRLPVNNFYKEATKKFTSSVTENPIHKKGLSEVSTRDNEFEEIFEVPSWESPDVVIRERHVGPDILVKFPGEPVMNPYTNKLMPSRIEYYVKGELKGVRIVEKNPDNAKQANVDLYGRSTYDHYTYATIRGESTVVHHYRNQYEYDGLLYSQGVPLQNELTIYNVDRSRKLLAETGTRFTLRLMVVPMDNPKARPIVVYDTKLKVSDDGLFEEMIETELSLRDTYDPRNNNAPMPDTIKALAAKYNLKTPEGRLPMWKVIRSSYRDPRTTNPFGGDADPTDEIETPEGLTVFTAAKVKNIKGKMVKGSELSRHFYRKNPYGRFYTASFGETAAGSEVVPTALGARRTTQAMFAQAEWETEGNPTTGQLDPNTGLLSVRVKTRIKVGTNQNFDPEDLNVDAYDRVQSGANVKRPNQSGDMQATYQSAQSNFIWDAGRRLWIPKNTAISNRMLGVADPNDPKTLMPPEWRTIESSQYEGKANFSEAMPDDARGVLTKRTSVIINRALEKPAEGQVTRYLDKAGRPVSMESTLPNTDIHSVAFLPQEDSMVMKRVGATKTALELPTEDVSDSLFVAVSVRAAKRSNLQMVFSDGVKTVIVGADGHMSFYGLNEAAAFSYFVKEPSGRLVQASVTPMFGRVRSVDQPRGTELLVVPVAELRMLGLDVSNLKSVQLENGNDSIEGVTELRRFRSSEGYGRDGVAQSRKLVTDQFGASHIEKLTPPVKVIHGSRGNTIIERGVGKNRIREVWLWGQLTQRTYFLREADQSREVTIRFLPNPDPALAQSFVFLDQPTGWEAAVTISADNLKASVAQFIGNGFKGVKVEVHPRDRLKLQDSGEINQSPYVIMFNPYTFIYEDLANDWIPRKNLATNMYNAILRAGGIEDPRIAPYVQSIEVSALRAEERVDMKSTQYPIYSALPNPIPSDQAVMSQHKRAEAPVSQKEIVSSLLEKASNNALGLPATVVGFGLDNLAETEHLRDFFEAVIENGNADQVKQIFDRCWALTDGGSKFVYNSFNVDSKNPEQHNLEFNKRGRAEKLVLPQFAMADIGLRYWVKTGDDRGLKLFISMLKHGLDFRARDPDKNKENQNPNKDQFLNGFVHWEPGEPINWTLLGFELIRAYRVPDGYFSRDNALAYFYLKNFRNVFETIEKTKVANETVNGNIHTLVKSFDQVLEIQKTWLEKYILTKHHSLLLSSRQREQRTYRAILNGTNDQSGSLWSVIKKVFTLEAAGATDKEDKYVIGEELTNDTESTLYLILAGKKIGMEDDKLALFMDKLLEVSSVWVNDGNGHRVWSLAWGPASEVQESGSPYLVGLLLKASRAINHKKGILLAENSLQAAPLNSGYYTTLIGVDADTVNLKEGHKNENGRWNYPNAKGERAQPLSLMGRPLPSLVQPDLAETLKDVPREWPGNPIDTLMVNGAQRSNEIFEPIVVDPTAKQQIEKNADQSSLANPELKPEELVLEKEKEFSLSNYAAFLLKTMWSDTNAVSITVKIMTGYYGAILLWTLFTWFMFRGIRIWKFGFKGYRGQLNDWKVPPEVVKALENYKIRSANPLVQQKLAQLPKHKQFMTESYNNFAVAVAGVKPWEDATRNYLKERERLWNFYTIFNTKPSKATAESMFITHMFLVNLLLEAFNHMEAADRDRLWSFYTDFISKPGGDAEATVESMYGSNMFLNYLLLEALNHIEAADRERLWNSYTIFFTASGGDAEATAESMFIANMFLIYLLLEAFNHMEAPDRTAPHQLPPPEEVYIQFVRGVQADFSKKLEDLGNGVPSDDINQWVYDDPEFFMAEVAEELRAALAVRLGMAPRPSFWNPSRGKFKNKPDMVKTLGRIGINFENDKWSFNQKGFLDGLKDYKTKERTSSWGNGPVYPDVKLAMHLYFYLFFGLILIAVFHAVLVDSVDVYLETIPAVWNMAQSVWGLLSVATGIGLAIVSRLASIKSNNRSARLRITQASAFLGLALAFFGLFLIPSPTMDLAIILVALGMVILGEAVVRAKFDQSLLGMTVRFNFPGSALMSGFASIFTFHLRLILFFAFTVLIGLTTWDWFYMGWSSSTPLGFLTAVGGLVLMVVVTYVVRNLDWNRVLLAFGFGSLGWIGVALASGSPYLAVGLSFAIGIIAAFLVPILNRWFSAPAAAVFNRLPQPFQNRIRWILATGDRLDNNWFTWGDKQFLKPNGKHDYVSSGHRWILIRKLVFVGLMFQLWISAYYESEVRLLVGILSLLSTLILTRYALKLFIELIIGAWILFFDLVTTPFRYKKPAPALAYSLIVAFLLELVFIAWQGELTNLKWGFQIIYIAFFSISGAYMISLSIWKIYVGLTKKARSGYMLNILAGLDSLTSPVFHDSVQKDANGNKRTDEEKIEATTKLIMNNWRRFRENSSNAMYVYVYGNQAMLESLRDHMGLEGPIFNEGFIRTVNYELVEKIIEHVVNALHRMELANDMALWDPQGQLWDESTPEKFRLTRGAYANLSDDTKQMFTFAFDTRRWMIEVLSTTPGNSSYDTAVALVEYFKYWKAQPDRVDEKLLIPVNFIIEAGKDPKDANEELIHRQKLISYINYLAGAPVAGAGQVATDQDIALGARVGGNFLSKAIAMQGKTVLYLTDAPFDIADAAGVKIKDRNGNADDPKKEYEDKKAFMADQRNMTFFPDRDTDLGPDQGGDMALNPKKGEGGMSTRQKAVYAITADTLAPGWELIEGVEGFVETPMRLVLDPLSATQPLTRGMWESGRYSIWDFLFGPVMLEMMQILQSEDYGSNLASNRVQINLGRDIHRRMTKALNRKMREGGHPHSLNPARWRWVMGLMQLLSTVLMRNIYIFGPISYYDKEHRGDGEEYYLLSHIVMANITTMGFLILQNWTPFTGIDAPWYVFGLTAMIVLAFHGLLRSIRMGGPIAGLPREMREFLIGLTVWAAGTDTENVARAKGNALGAKFSYSFIPSAPSPFTGDNASDYFRKNWDHEKDKRTVRIAAIAFWDQVISGFVYVVLYYFALTKLDILNVVLLYLPLIVITGLLLANFVNDNVVGQKGKWHFVFAPLGLVLGLLLNMSIGAHYGVLPWAHHVAGAIVLFVTGFYLIFKLIPRAAAQKPFSYMALISLVVAIPLTFTTFLNIEGFVMLVGAIASIIILNRFVYIRGKTDEIAAKRQAKKPFDQIVPVLFILVVPLTLTPFLSSSAFVIAIGVIALLMIINRIIPIPVPGLATVQEIATDAYNWIDRKIPWIRKTVEKQKKKYEENLGAYKEKALALGGKDEVRARYATVLSRNFVLSAVITMWPGLVPVAGLVSYQIGQHLVTVQLATFAVGVAIAIMLVAGLVMFGIWLEWILTRTVHAWKVREFVERDQHGLTSSKDPARFVRLRALLISGLVMLDVWGDRIFRMYMDDTNEIFDAMEEEQDVTVSDPTQGRSLNGDTPPSRHSRRWLTLFTLTLLVSMVVAGALHAATGAPLAHIARDWSTYALIVGGLIGLLFGPGFVAFVKTKLARSEIDEPAPTAVVSSPERRENRARVIGTLLKIAGKETKDRSAEEKKFAINALASLDVSRPLGVSQFLPGNNVQLGQLRDINPTILYQGVYLAEFASQKPDELRSLLSAKDQALVQKIVFTPRSDDPKKILKEIKRLKTRVPAEQWNQVQIEVRLLKDDYKLQAALVDLLAKEDATLRVTVGFWLEVATLSDEKAMDLLLNVNGSPAGRLHFLVAQGADLPADVNALLKLMESKLTDRMKIAVLLAESLQVVPLSSNELFDMRKFTLIASQA